MGEMLLYHTGFQPIPRPDVHRGRKNADFGRGFYLTYDPAFAQRWASGRRDADVYINTYLFDPGDLDILSLDRDEKWFDILFSYRQGTGDPTAGYDAVAGPIANDTLYDVMGILTSGLIEREKALSLLRLGPEYRQIALRTEKAAERLQWLSADIPDPASAARALEALREEERAFQALFAEKLARLTEK